MFQLIYQLHTFYVIFIMFFSSRLFFHYVWFLFCSSIVCFPPQYMLKCFFYFYILITVVWNDLCILSMPHVGYNFSLYLYPYFEMFSSLNGNKLSKTKWHIWKLINYKFRGSFWIDYIRCVFWFLLFDEVEYTWTKRV